MTAILFQYGHCRFKPDMSDSASIKGRLKSADCYRGQHMGGENHNCLL
jgi:hypothetical protein